MRAGRTMAAALVLLLGACSGSSSSEPDETVREILDRSAAAMAALESARFEMERSGAPVSVQGMVFDSAVGQYAAPDSARALLQVKAAGLTIELGTISIGDRTWLTNPLTQKWEELGRGSGFNPAIIFDTAIGWKPLLTQDLADPSLQSGENGGDGYLITGEVAARRVDVLTAGLVAEQPVDLELWIDPQRSLVTRLEFATTGEEGESTWVIRLDEFDEPVSIEAPSES